MDNIVDLSTIFLIMLAAAFIVAAVVLYERGPDIWRERPWSVEEQPACFVVRDHNAYVYFENEPGRRSAAKLLTKDEARRIAANVFPTHMANMNIALLWRRR